VATLYPQLATSIECEPELPDFRFDPDQIRIVLVNLFENSASMANPAAPGRVQLSLGKVGTDVVMMFSDDGPGIPKENISKIFDPYFTTRDGGTGLGLAMVKNIVLLHGGSIHAHSAEGKGTTLTMALPLTGPEQSTETTKDS
jgi:two-component system nitrogen regulation sensor histidine kinase NtrY